MASDSGDRVYQQLAQDLTKKSLPTEGRTRVRVISDSMAPLILSGDAVVIEKVLLNELKRGDIIMIFRNGEFITHRFISRQKNEWYTKGDQYHSLDQPVASEDIIGKVIEIERQDLRLELVTRKWKLINRYRGWLAYTEVVFYRFAKYIRGVLLSAGLKRRG